MIGRCCCRCWSPSMRISCWTCQRCVVTHTHTHTYTQTHTHIHTHNNTHTHTHTDYLYKLKKKSSSFSFSFPLTYIHTHTHTDTHAHTFPLTFIHTRSTYTHTHTHPSSSPIENKMLRPDQMKWLALFLLVLQNTALVLLMRSSLTRPGDHYIVTTAVACMEVSVYVCVCVFF